MKLDRVTITGADDSVNPADLIALSKEFPFVEWGILLSKSKIGTPRFPSFQWLFDLCEAMEGKEGTVRLSCHVCGFWCKELLAGRWSMPWQPDDRLIYLFDRCQLNFNAAPDADPKILAKGLGIWENDGPAPDLIIQHHDVNRPFFEELCAEMEHWSIYPLFDRSGGKGEVPTVWPEPEYYDDPDTLSRHGYAGGLSPDTLCDQLPLIHKAAGNARVWIDMESGVRSNEDNQFDLAKVRECLEICQPWIMQ